MIQVYRLSFAHKSGGFQLAVPELTLTRGESVAITGPSGSGKTTLLDLMAGILQPDTGTISVNNVDLASLTDAAGRAFRAENIGLIFQEFELLEYVNVHDNILLPFRISANLKLTPAVHQYATTLAQRTGIADKLGRFPDQLSQGERQRVAVCRALIAKPSLLLADEPTGNLDPANKTRVLDLLLALAQEHNATLITVTHDHELTSRFDRVVDFGTLTTAAA